MTERTAPDLVSRRTLAGMAGITAIGLPLLSACGGSDSSASDSAGSTARRSGATNPAAPSSSAVAPSSGATPSAGGGTADGLTPTSDIPVGGGKIFSDQNVVVTQPTAGEFKGFSSTCTHQGCQVNKVVSGSIECPCHGSSFSIVDGSVQGGPAPSPLSELKLSVVGEEISLA